MSYDVIVIGSGFGGAITACRLAEKGYKVLILERGRRWDNSNFPRKPEDPWVWNQREPEKQNGWLDLRVFKHMAVAQGAAVGGGSLIYANISCEAPAHVFQSGWPQEITYAELKPHYDRVAQFMNVQPIPANQWTRRMKLMKEAAEKIGKGDRFKPLELAVTFDPKWNYEQNDPHNPAKSVSFINAQGAQQGTCVHLGNCDIGCDVHAKNTLDRNYIYWAEKKHNAEVRPLSLVTDIVPVGGGYKVFYDELAGNKRVPRNETARLVIVAAGSLGSTELLLRCRDVTRTLPDLSRFLGLHWSSNGDFLTPAFYPLRDVSPTRGPTISSAIDFLDASEGGQRFWIEDGGVPNLLADYLQRLHDHPPTEPMVRMVFETLRHLLRDSDPFRNMMPWFAQGMDAANGLLQLDPGHQLDLQWDITRSQAVMDEIVKMHERLSVATLGVPFVPPSWTLARMLVTPHPLGGCNMGEGPENGVVSHKGEVFGYPGLFVSDGAIVPEALGVNPSRTIGALAERIAQLIAAESR